MRRSGPGTLERHGEDADPPDQTEHGDLDGPLPGDARFPGLHGRSILAADDATANRFSALARRGGGGAGARHQPFPVSLGAADRGDAPPGAVLMEALKATIDDVFYGQVIVPFALALIVFQLV